MIVKSLVAEEVIPWDGARSAGREALAACRFSKYLSRDTEISATVMPLPNVLAEAADLRYVEDADGEGPVDDGYAVVRTGK